MVEVRLGILCGGKVACGCLSVEIEEEVTCGELLDELADVEGAGLDWSGAERGAWHLVERWNGCERRLDDEERVAEAVMRWKDGGRVWLKFDALTSSGKKVTSSRKRRKVDYLSGPLTEKKLSLLRRDLRRQYVATSARASSLWLRRLAERRPLAAGDQPLQPLRERLAQLRQRNLELSTEISQLNIRSGALSAELQVARSEGRELGEGVRSVEEEVRVRRREREKESGTRLADLQAEALRLRRELETRNRLNAAQNSKLQAQKELLDQKRTARLKKLQSHDNHVTQTARSRDPIARSRDPMATHPQSRSESPPQSEGQSLTPSSNASSTRKRRATFEARTRQLLEAEAEQFRRQREGEKTTRHNSVRKLDFSLTTPPATPTGDEPSALLSVDMIEEGQKLLAVPEADTLWYRTNSDDISYKEKIDRVLGEVKGETGDHTQVGMVGGNFFSEVMSSVRQSVGGVRDIGREKKRVSFSPEAVILSAALEGDLPTLRDCVEKLGCCQQTSHKGATCLHNAVCAGHMPSLQYLVEMGCDINAQDDDGWTPLHCTVAYSSAEALTYLLTHGASLWLETGEEGETAEDLGERELAAQREEGDEAGQEATQHCLTLLQKAHRDLGVANGGVVYALFSREATEVGELGVCEGERLVLVRGEAGEGWWEVEREGGERGMVPVTFLGSAPRYQVTI